ncbi:MAG: hypothetical protein Q9180_007623, partial [Flavoplaca navasiana]
LLIFLCRSSLFIIARLRSYSEVASAADVAHAFYTYLAFTLDYAVEFPLFLAYHPTALAFPNHVVHTVPLLSVHQSVVQVLVFFLLDWAFQFYILRFLSLPDRTDQYGPKDAEADDAFKLALAFIRPRGALLIAIAVIGSPSPLNTYTGKLHVLSMVSWVTLSQLGGLFESQSVKKVVGA